MKPQPITYEEQFIRDFLNSLQARKNAMKMKASYEAGRSNILTSSLPSFSRTGDQELRWTLRALRARSRYIAENNPYAKKFFKSLVINCIGKDGIRLQNQAIDDRIQVASKKGKPAKPQFDKLGNEIIESGWQDWSQDGICEITGRLDLIEFCGLALEAIAKDGEILVRKYKGWKGNKYRFCLQLIEADHLDEYYNVYELANGNRIIMGVEIDPNSRPVAYHLLKKHPGDFPASPRTYIRVPADEIDHIYVIDRVNQNRGVPWLYASMLELNNLGAFREAAIINARVGAAKMGFFTSVDEDAVEFTPEMIANHKTDDEDSTGTHGEFISDAIPGAMVPLPKGWTYKEHNPAYPSNEFGPFNKAVLQGACAGMLSAYSTITGDLEAVNFSSIRSGKIDERDMYKFLTSWFIRKTVNKWFPQWLELSLLSGALKYGPPSNQPLPFAKFDKFNKPAWQSRGFDWVDPQKDIEADILAVNNCLKSRTEICGEHGRDFRDVCAQIAEENAIAEEYGIDLSNANDAATFQKMLPAKKESGGNGDGKDNTGNKEGN